MTWFKRVIYPKPATPPPAASVLEDGYTLAQAQVVLTESKNQVAMSGYNASPNVFSQSFQVPARTETRYLDEVIFTLTRIGTLNGVVQVGVFPKLGSHGTTAIPNNVAGPYILSEQIDASSISSGSVYERVSFGFEDDFELEPLANLCVVIRFIGTSAIGNYMQIGMAGSGLPQPVIKHAGNYAQGFVENPVHFDPTWPNVSGLTPVAGLDFFFEVYSRPPAPDQIETIANTIWTGKTNPSSSWAGRAALPSTGWGRFSGFDDFFIREPLRFISRVTIIRNPRNITKLAREKLSLSELTLSRDVNPTFTEDLELLDSASVEAVVRFRAFEAEDALSLLESAVRDIDFRQVDILARDYLSLSESITLKMRRSLSEATLLLERASVLKPTRNLAIVAHEYLRMGTETIALRKSTAVILTENTKLFDRVTVVKNSRAIVKSGRELFRISESISTVLPLPSIESAQINNPLDMDDDNQRIRCRYVTGSFTESVRIMRSVNGAGFVLHQNMDASPNAGPFISDWYNGSTTQVVYFSIKPFDGDGQTGIEGVTVFTNAEIIGDEGV
jgi:hypothetical protein